MTPDERLNEWRRRAAAPFEGWDFSHIGGKFIEGEPPWSYLALAKAASAQAFDILDVATGGGEVFASLAPFPGRTAAVEGFMPTIEWPGGAWTRSASKCAKAIPVPASPSRTRHST